MWLVLRDAMSTEAIPPSSTPREPPVIVVIVAPGVCDGVTPAYRIRSAKILPILSLCAFSFLFTTTRTHALRTIHRQLICNLICKSHFVLFPRQAFRQPRIINAR